MKYQVNDRVNGPRVFDTEEEALTVLPEAQAALLAREEYRFGFATVVTEENNTIWRNSVNEDPEEGDYRVFVHTTGQYENYTKKSEAQARVNELKSEFLLIAQLDKVYEHVIAQSPTATMPISVL